MIFENGIFSPRNIGDERTEKVLLTAIERASGFVRPCDLLASAIEDGEPKVLAALSQALEPGCTPRDLIGVIAVYNPARSTPNTDFDGKRERFSTEMLEALSQFETGLKKKPEGARDVVLELLLGCVLSNLDAEDSEYLTTLDAERGADLFRRQVSFATEPLTPLFDSDSGRLLSDEFSESAWVIMEHAGIRAADLGYDRILEPHVFLALLGETEGVAEHLVRLQAKPEIGPGKVADIVTEGFRLSDRKVDPIELTRDGIGEASVEMLKAAQKTALLWGSEQIGTHHLLSVLVDRMPQRLASVLKQGPLDLDLVKMREHLDQYLREVRTQVKQEVAFKLPVGLLPSEDLTYRARTEDLKPALHLDPYFDTMTRALYRRKNNHVLVTGLRGVGKTTLVRELARKAAAGDIDFLKRKRFILVDCAAIAPQESKDKIEGILTHVAGRSDLILCLDGLGQLLRAESGGDNKLLLRSALKESKIHLIGIISNQDFEDLLGADHELLEYFTRVNMEEPGKDASIDIAGQVYADLEKEFKITVEGRTIERAVVLSADYILSERLPLKAVKILRRACENLDYERTQCGKKRDKVTADDVVKIVAEISNVPEETLTGTSKKTDYEKNLGAVVIGQEEAVKAVATDLKLIKAGRTQPNKPASVMFFAGLTGVGKTELAKSLAKFYSSSKRLQTYTMGNFTQAHTISQIVGVPPGYVGHEQGGRLVNDLNSDPYCVFLLDEAEKAHPDIWKPFLNLFDEGWVVDTRGIKAFGDRAIFILTSNAGHEIISRMSRAGEPMEKIIEAVKGNLSEIRHSQSPEPVFSPEFLARIKRIIIFKPLDQDAMEGICRNQVKKLQKNYEKKLEKTLLIPENLIKYIGEQSHSIDKKSGGKEGGRIVSKLLQELVEVTIDSEAGEHEQEYKKCEIIELAFIPPGPALPHQPVPKPKVGVNFLSHRSSSPSTGISSAAAELKQALDTSDEFTGPAHRAVLNTLNRLKANLEDRPAASEKIQGGLLTRVEEVFSLLKEQKSRSEKEIRGIVERLISSLEDERSNTK
jgi:ATP-dependent Clp protease ATP-binding subunit ClpA